MKKGNKYKCIYVSGGGTEYDEGEWQIKILTEKTVVIEKITEQRVYGNFERGSKIVCRKGNRNLLNDLGDGTFTIYPQQSGTPYYFTPL